MSKGFGRRIAREDDGRLASDILLLLEGDQYCGRDGQHGKDNDRDERQVD